MSYLRYSCLFTYCSVQHLLCFCFVFLRLVYTMLSVSLDCHFLIDPSILSSVYYLMTVCIYSCHDLIVL